MNRLSSLAVVAAALALTLTSAVPAKAEMNLVRQPTREELRLARELPQTLVIRVNERNGQFEVYNSYDRIDRKAKDRVSKVKFKKMTAKDKMKGHARGANLAWSPLSWLLGFSFGWNEPYYSYGGYSYPYSYYDNYSYGDGYSYYYYGNPYWGW